MHAVGYIAFILSQTFTLQVLAIHLYMKFKDKELCFHIMTLFPIASILFIRHT